MIAQATRTAAELVGQYVRRQPNEPGGKISLGYFYATCEEGGGGGWVFDFATKESVRALPSLCSVVPKTSITGGVKGLTVSVPGWKRKIGRVAEENFDFHNKLQVRVVSGEGRDECSVLVKFTSVEVVVPR